MQFSFKIGQIIGWRPTQGLPPSSGKSWIHHCLHLLHPAMQMCYFITLCTAITIVLFIKGSIFVQHICEEGWRHTEHESRYHGNQESAAAVCGGTEGGQSGNGNVQQRLFLQGLRSVWWMDRHLLRSPGSKFWDNTLCAVGNQICQKGKYQPQRWRRQHIMLVYFPQNCIKMKQFGTREGAACVPWHPRWTHQSCVMVESVMIQNSPQKFSVQMEFRFAKVCGAVSLRWWSYLHRILFWLAMYDNVFSMLQSAGLFNMHYAQTSFVKQNSICFFIWTCRF